MVKKGFKLPGVTPLKQTAGNSFFQNLPMRPYVSTGAYANPQTYFGESSLGADIVSTIGNTFADSINAATQSNKDSDSDGLDVSGSDLTIDPTGQLPAKTTTNPGLERGGKPKLEKKIAKAEAKGNLKKAARLQAKQDRNIVRQTEGEKRIKARQDEKLDRVTKRQEGLTRDFEDKNFAGRMLSSIGNVFRRPTPPDRDLSQKQTVATELKPVGVVEPDVEIEGTMLMKKESPNNFLGGITAGIAGGSGRSGGGFGSFLNSSLGRAAAQVAGPSQAQQAAAASTAAGGTMGTANQNPMTGGTIPEGGGKFQLTPVAMSYDPPLQANEKGGKKSVFNMDTKGMAESAFGSPAERQASVKAPFQSNAFYAALNDAKEKGAKTFEVGGKTFNVQNK